MTTVSLPRLYGLRAIYLLLVVGLGLTQWPALLQRGTIWDRWHGVGASLLAAVCALALLGLRYPLKFIPLLLFELTWKTIWLAVVALPLWMSHQVTPPIRETTFDCAMGLLIFPLGIPWGYVWQTYVKAPGEPWRRRPSGLTERQVAVR